MDRLILFCLPTVNLASHGQDWQKKGQNLTGLAWVFSNWKAWEDDSDEDLSNFDHSSEMMNNMSGDEDVDGPEVDGADDDSQDGDDIKTPALE